VLESAFAELVDATEEDVVEDDEVEVVKVVEEEVVNVGGPWILDPEYSPSAQIETMYLLSELFAIGVHLSTAEAFSPT
jgi:hypothetical protein